MSLAEEKLEILGLRQTQEITVRNSCQVEWRGRFFEVKDRLRVLGSWIGIDREVDLEESLAAAWAAFWKHRKQLACRRVCLKARWQRWVLVVGPVLRWCCGSWRWSAAAAKQIHAAVGAMQRIMSPVARGVEESWVDWQVRSLRLVRGRFGAFGIPFVCCCIRDWCRSTQRWVSFSDGHLLRRLLEWRTALDSRSMGAAFTAPGIRWDGWRRSRRGRPPNRWEHVFVQERGLFWAGNPPTEAQMCITLITDIFLGRIR